MNRIQRSRFEEMLFYQAFYDETVKEAVIDRMKKYKKAYEEYGLHEAAFGIKYCKALLNSNGERIPYKTLMELTGNEPITSYYFYRQLVLEKLSKEINVTKK